MVLSRHRRRGSVPTAGSDRRGGARCGALIAIAAASLTLFPFLLPALVLLGAGSATGLQARFAATILATDATRGRSLALVVWSTVAA